LRNIYNILYAILNIIIHLEKQDVMPGGAVGILTRPQFCPGSEAEFGIMQKVISGLKPGLFQPATLRLIGISAGGCQAEFVRMRKNFCPLVMSYYIDARNHVETSPISLDPRYPVWCRTTLHLTTGAYSLPCVVRRVTLLAMSSKLLSKWEVSARVPVAAAAAWTTGMEFLRQFV